MEFTVGQIIRTDKGAELVIDGIQDVSDLPNVASHQKEVGWLPLYIHAVPRRAGRGRLCFVDAKTGSIVEVCKA